MTYPVAQNSHLDDLVPKTVGTGRHASEGGGVGHVDGEENW